MSTKEKRVELSEVMMRLNHVSNEIRTNAAVASNSMMNKPYTPKRIDK